MSVLFLALILLCNVLVGKVIACHANLQLGRENGWDMLLTLVVVCESVSVAAVGGVGVHCNVV